MKTLSIRYMAGALAGLTLTLLAGTVQAATVAPAFEKSGFIIGTGGETTPFTVAEAGTYRATLTDFGAGGGAGPSPFSQLEFLIATATELKLYGTAPGSTFSTTFDAVPGVTYFANIVGVSSGLVGFYGAEVALVPIPMSALMLASALVGFAVVGRRKRDAAESAAAA